MCLTKDKYLPPGGCLSCLCRISMTKEELNELCDMYRKAFNPHEELEARENLELLKKDDIIIQSVEVYTNYGKIYLFDDLCDLNVIKSLYKEQTENKVRIMGEMKEAFEKVKVIFPKRK